MILLSVLAVFLTWWLQDPERKQVEDVANDVGPVAMFGLAIYAIYAM
jgi:hypothetical protein